ncbi:SAM-dependent methyltransferase [Salinactinospora qingdaonensis]|uniref:SAM-dependent methyltransferase n=1 Tax=Salinactinospora qingdaonensis TaxID=702744 RepID=A0ABP7G2P7_9ACTN
MKSIPRTSGSTATSPPDIDMTRPSVARSYDAMMGGKDNFQVDRDLAEQVRDLVPEMPLVCKDNREFLIRVTRYFCRLGIEQFLDLGAGLPTMENTHQAAQRVTPNARVVYVDNDPIVLAHGRAMLEENAQTGVVVADIRAPETVFAAEPTQRLLRLDEPVGLLLISIIHHLDDTDEPHRLVRSYLDRLPSGSMMAISHFFNPGGAFAEQARRTEQVCLRGLGSGRFRSREEITALFEGTDLVEPGVGFLPHWWPDGPPPEHLRNDQHLLLCGVARKP